jgi:hypothetical protein
MVYVWQIKQNPPEHLSRTAEDHGREPMDECQGYNEFKQSSATGVSPWVSTNGYTIYSCVALLSKITPYCKEYKGGFTQIDFHIPTLLWIFVGSKL